MPHLDRLVGVPKEYEEDTENMLAVAHRETGGRFIEGFEREKTPRDREVIQEVKMRLADILSEYGREVFDVPDGNIHLLSIGGTEKYTKGKLSAGVTEQCTAMSLWIGRRQM